MIEYRKIVERELAAREQAVQTLDDAEPLDAQDEQLRGELEAACSALICVLRAFEAEEYAALDAMYVEHLRRAGDRARREKRCPC